MTARVRPTIPSGNTLGGLERVRHLPSYKSEAVGLDRGAERGFWFRTAIDHPEILPTRKLKNCLTGAEDSTTTSIGRTPRIPF
jgi:hypothetical protein